MKFVGVFAILIISYFSQHTIRANYREDTAEYRYFECDVDSDDCCDDFGEHGNNHRIRHTTSDDDSDDSDGYGYFFGDDNCKRRNKVRLTVLEPLHSYLTSLLETSLEPAVIEMNKIITDVERKTGTTISNVDAAGIPQFFKHLVTSTDNVFDLIRRRIFDFIDAEVPDYITVTEDFLGYLSNLKLSIHDLNDSIAHNSDSRSSLRPIEDAALILAFALIDFLSSAMQLIENLSSWSANSQVSVGRVLVEFFGVLQLTFDAIDSSDVASGVLFGNKSRITSCVKSLIFDIFSSLVNRASDLSTIFRDDFSNTSKYFHQFNRKFNESTTLYRSGYNDLLNSVENLFEIVRSSSSLFGEQLELLVHQFSRITLDNASSVFEIIPSYVDGIFGIIDFMLFTLNSRAPHTLISETNLFLAKAHDVQLNFKLLLKAIFPPIVQSAFLNITQVAVQLMYMYEVFMTAGYKFIIAASGLMSQLVTELMATVILVLDLFTHFYNTINIATDDLTKLYTGQTIPFFSILTVIGGMATFYSAVGKIICLTPAMYSTKTETVPAELERMSLATDSALKSIKNVYSSQVEVIPYVDLEIVNQVVNVLQTINLDAQQLISAVTCLSGASLDKVATDAIDRDAEKLAGDIQQLTAAISRVALATYNNVQNANQTAINGTFRELLNGVLQIVYYVVFSVTTYLHSVIPESATISLLSNIENAIIAALSQSTVQLRDFNKFLDNDIPGFKHMISYVTTSVNKTVASLAQTLNGIVAPVIVSPRRQNVRTELYQKLEIVISTIHVDINNGNAEEISDGLRNLLTSTRSSFESITNAVQQVIGMFPNEWKRYANVVRSSSPNVQIQTHSFIHDVLNLIKKSTNIPVRDVRVSAIRAVSAVSDFGKAISELVNAAANELSYENVLLLVALQKILAINSQATSDVVSAISNLLDIIAASKNNPLGDLSNLLNNMSTSTNSFTDGFTLSTSDSSLSNVYNQIKMTLNTCNSQLSNGIATITITLN